MKKKILPFVIICFFSFKMHSNTDIYITKYPSPIFDSLEVILSLSEYSEINYTTLLASLKSMPGVNYTAFCGNHAVFLFYIDKTIYPTKELFHNDFVKLYDLQSLTALKDGSIKEILKFCSFVNSSDAAAYKLTQ